MIRGAAVLVLLAGALLAAGGCSSDPARGYSFESTREASIRTVALPVFRNETYNERLEIDLAHALANELRRAAGWSVTNRSDADAVLTGTITAYRLRPLTTGRVTGMVQEVAVQVVVDFSFVDARTGRTLVARRNFTASSSFVPARPAAERVETGEHAAVDELARDIVAELRSAW